MSRVAGLDVHRDSVVACFRQLGPRGGVVREKERFTTTTAGLQVLEAWLAERQVQLVAMEATGVYWKPVLYALERRFTVWLCNARHVKKLPGRKTDLTDAEWLADVAAHGMVRASFVPPVPIRELRELTRYRKTQIDTRAAETTGGVERDPIDAMESAAYCPLRHSLWTCVCSGRDYNHGHARDALACRCEGPILGVGRPGRASAGPCRRDPERQASGGAHQR